MPTVRPTSPTTPSLRERVRDIVFEADTPAGKTFDAILIVAIILSVFVVILSTMDFATTEPYRSRFLAVEWCFTILFTAEYAVRLAVVRRPFRYAVSFFGIVDLLSILPAFIGLFLPSGEHLLVIRTLRLLRIFRIFKLGRYLSEAALLRRSLIRSRQKLAVFLTTITIVVLIASAFMHVVEGTAGNEPFESLPMSMYWAVITMTTVGYGDMVPITALGRFITSALVLVGYSMIIVPTGILSAELIGSARRHETTRVCPSCLTEGHLPEARYCWKCGATLSLDDPPRSA